MTESELSAKALDDPVALTQTLVQAHTAGADESSIARPLASALEDAGLSVRLMATAPGRENLVASWRGGSRLVLCGHLDTVPFTSSGWHVDPTGGEIAGDALYGRGASDMKGGVAAMVVAALRAARAGSDAFTLALTVGEETGCIGARDLVAAHALPRRPILVVGESTENTLRLGHRGATWLRVTAHGTQAHGSAPERGDNAIERLAQLIVALRDFGQDASDRHPQLGTQTVNVGRIEGGLQTNIVPAFARAELDIRTVPGGSLDAVFQAIAAAVPRNDVETMLHLPPVWTPPESALSRRMREHVASAGHEGDVGAVPYFTDAAAFAEEGASVYIVGPGGLDQPHTVDEHCSVQRIVDAEGLYRRMLDDAAHLHSLA